MRYHQRTWPKTIPKWTFHNSAEQQLKIATLSEVIVYRVLFLPIKLPSRYEGRYPRFPPQGGNGAFHYTLMLLSVNEFQTFLIVEEKIIDYLVDVVLVLIVVVLVLVVL